MVESRTERVTGWSRHFIDTFKAKWGQAPNYQVPEMAQNINLSEDELVFWYDQKLGAGGASAVQAFLAHGGDKSAFITDLKAGVFAGK